MRINTQHRYKIIVNGQDYKYTDDRLAAVRRGGVKAEQGYTVTVVDQDYPVGDARRYPYKSRPAL